MRIAVIGAGYVGLVTGAALAALGHRVRIGEADPERVATLAEGTVPFFEPGLDRLLSEGIADGLLTFHTDNGVAVEKAEVVIVALPTPPAAESTDPAVIETALRDFASSLSPGAVVALRST